MASCSRTTTGKYNKSQNRIKMGERVWDIIWFDLSGKDVIRLRYALCTK